MFIDAAKLTNFLLYLPRLVNIIYEANNRSKIF